MANRIVSSWLLRASQGFFRSRQVLSRVAMSMSSSSLHAPQIPASIGNRPSRLARKRRPVTAYCETTQEVVSLSIAESLDLASIYHDEAMATVYTCPFVDDEFEEALHIVPKDKYIIEKNALRDCFVFSDGVIVFWNISAMEREQIVRNLAPHSHGSYSDRLILEETDSMAFELIDSGKTRIDQDTVMLNIGQHEERQRAHMSILERYSFSHGFAASVKLAVWESQLNDYAETGKTA